MKFVLGVIVGVTLSRINQNSPTGLNEAVARKIDAVAPKVLDRVNKSLNAYFDKRNPKTSQEETER